MTSADDSLTPVLTLAGKSDSDPHAPSRSQRSIGNMLINQSNRIIISKMASYKLKRRTALEHQKDSKQFPKMLIKEANLQFNHEVNWIPL